MNEDGIFFADLISHLTDPFKEGETFNISHRTSNFNNHNIQIIAQLLDGSLDFVCDVGNDLNSLSQIVTPSFFLNDGLINFSSGGIVGPRQTRIRKTLVMSKIEVGLGTIIGDKNFTVLKRTHGSRIHVNIRIQLQ